MEMNVENKKLVFGLDIGTRSVVGTIGYKEDEKFIVIAQEIREHQTRAMLDGQIHDIGRVASTIQEIKNALEAKTGEELHDVCIAAAGRVLRTMTVNIDMEFEIESVITEIDLAELTSRGVEKAFNNFHKEFKTSVKFYCVGYSVIKYYVDDQEMGKPLYHKGKKIAADVIVTFLPNDVVDGLYSAVEMAGLSVSNLTLEPIAAIRVAIPEKYRLLNIAMIDVGAGTSDISITNGGTITAFGMIPCAGDNMTEKIAQKCLVDFETADKIKISASLMDKISFVDVMGLEQTVTSKEVIEMCKPEIEKTAKLAAEEIRRLNNGESPSAVFIVGGGGRIQSFSASIAKELDMDLQRVAIRGEEIMSDIEFPEGCLKDSTIITPIGICLASYDQTNKFINVNFNGNKMKLYDNNNLAVIDAAIQASFSRESLFPKRGASVTYTVNGVEKVAKGRYGESSEIFVNDEPADLNYKIKENDNIVMKKSTIGEIANVRVRDIEEYENKINITVNGNPVLLPKLFEVNGEAVSPETELHNNDSVVIHPCYTYNQLLDYMNKVESKVLIMINNELADTDSLISDGDVLEIVEKTVPVEEHDDNENSENNENMENNEKVESVSKTSEPIVISEDDLEEEISFEDQINLEVLGSIEKNEVKEETVNVFKNMIENAALEEQIEDAVKDPATQKMTVIVNKTPVTLDGKDSYMFVDIFEFIDFDTSKMKGSGIVTTVNGVQAQYTQALHVGDKIEVYWKQDQI